MMSLVSAATQKSSPVTFIEGPITDGHCWSSLVADLLLCELISSSRFKRVIVLTFDRSLSDIESLVTNIDDDTSKKRQILPSKLEFIQAFDVLAGERSMDEVFNKVIEMCSENANECEISDSKDNIGLEGSIGVVLYSVSSAILNDGRSKILKLIKRLISCLNPINGSESRGTIIGTLYSSLHSQKERALLRDFADTYCHLTPNLGSLSSLVAVEGHCIRRSEGGRVSETKELFSFEEQSVTMSQQSSSRAKQFMRGHRLWVPYRLKALQKMKTEVPNSNEKSLKDENQHDHSPESILSSMIPGDSGAAFTEKSRSDSQGQGNRDSADKTLMASRRLVTFNSTDPEFDEDSDPDADLDL